MDLISRLFNITIFNGSLCIWFILVLMWVIASDFKLVKVKVKLLWEGERSPLSKLVGMSLSDGWAGLGRLQNPQTFPNIAEDSPLVVSFFLPGHKFENICIGRSYWPPGDQNKKHGEAYVTRISHHVGSDYQRESCQFKEEQYSFEELSWAG